MRSFEILQYNLSFLPPLTDVERRFAVTTMASAEINVPDNAETMRRYRDEVAKKRAAAQKKKQAAEKSIGGAPVVVEQILESSPERNPLKKRQKRASAINRQKKAAFSSKDRSAGPDFKPDSPMKLLASGLSSFKDPAGFLKRSDDFTLVDDDLHLKNVKTEEVFDTLLLSNFQAYQATLHLHGRYKAVNDKSVALHKAGDALKAENAKLSTEKSVMEQQKIALEEALKNERDRHQAEVAKLKEAADQHEQTIEALRERALSIAVEAVCKTSQSFSRNTCRAPTRSGILKRCKKKLILTKRCSVSNLRNPKKERASREMLKMSTGALEIMRRSTMLRMKLLLPMVLPRRMAYKIFISIL
ncbi:hypothetical protein LWI29_035334 [Acer saccharum]|uniref:Uncharacterized protein n=1 Tax=Acer saccharum TaxID=4024 RepID=A0AA39VL38_ACESA|nr:hypothetical protein LWI29_035334 [Acer saccharum]